jgi:hypothetical protein
MVVPPPYHTMHTVDPHQVSGIRSDQYDKLIKSIFFLNFLHDKHMQMGKYGFSVTLSLLPLFGFLQLTGKRQATTATHYTRVTRKTASIIDSRTDSNTTKRKLDA